MNDIQSIYAEIGSFPKGVYPTPLSAPFLMDTLSGGNTMLTQSELKEKLSYDRSTGVFVWRENAKVAGYINAQGYIYIGFNNVVYLAHRLAWLYIKGYFPEGCLDHIDRNPKNNRIDNLREASRMCNMRNTGNHKNNTSGIKGVLFYKRDANWQSTICVNRKKYHLGYFDDFDEAVAHRLAAEQCFNWAGCNSSSPAYKYINGG